MGHRAPLLLQCPYLLREDFQLPPDTPSPLSPSCQDYLEVTETFKQKKVRLTAEGFDPTQISDPLYVLDNAAKTYMPLTRRTWEGIVAGDIRL